MENLTQIASVPIIASVVYGALTLYKNAVGDKEKFIKIIPVLAAALGVILGIIAFYAVPEIIAADNIFTAILVGGSSGLAATGTNQIFKQLLPKAKETEEEKSDDASRKE